jgi:hypothetical protein
MGKSTPIQIGFLSFKSKKEAKDYIRLLFSKYENSERIKDTDDTLLRDLILLHPESEAKVGIGISHFTIELDQEWGTTRHFVIIRDDGSSTDFSFHTCIDGTNDRQDRYSAMRNAVAYQVVDFKALEFSGDVLPICFYLKCTLTESEAHVDHEAPQTFHVLANAWLQANGLKIEDLELVDNADNQWIRKLRREDQIKSWQEFHLSRAKLRIISKRANLSNAKAKMKAK